MTTRSTKTTEVCTVEACAKPGVGALLPAYIVGLASDSDAERVEAHLVDCLYCKDRYVTVLRVRNAARKERIGSVKNDKRSRPENNQSQIVDVEKRRA